jgi:hypothetical protein
VDCAAPADASCATPSRPHESCVCRSPPSSRRTRRRAKRCPTWGVAHDRHGRDVLALCQRQPHLAHGVARRHLHRLRLHGQGPRRGSACRADRHRSREVADHAHDGLRRGTWANARTGSPPASTSGTTASSPPASSPSTPADPAPSTGSPTPASTSPPKPSSARHQHGVRRRARPGPRRGPLRDLRPPRPLDGPPLPRRRHERLLRLLHDSRPRTAATACATLAERLAPKPGRSRSSTRSSSTRRSTVPQGRPQARRPLRPYGVPLVAAHTAESDAASAVRLARAIIAAKPEAFRGMTIGGLHQAQQQWRASR